MRRVICCLMAIAGFLAGQRLCAFYGRVSHDTGNANAARRANSDVVELDEILPQGAFALFARREQIDLDRTFVNALAFVSAVAKFPGHTLQFGAGTHFSQKSLEGKPAEPGIFAPALALIWTTSKFRGELAGSEKFSRATMSVLARIVFPVEFNTDFEAAATQALRWSANAFVHLSDYFGLIGGYEPFADRARAGLWLRPVQGLNARLLARLHTRAETLFELSLTYHFDAAVSAPHTEAAVTAVMASAEDPRRKFKKTPAFATLVKWGLSPVEALRLAREKDICKLSASAQAILSKHKWVCRPQDTEVSGSVPLRSASEHRPHG